MYLEILDQARGGFNGFLQAFYATALVAFITDCDERPHLHLPDPQFSLDYHFHIVIFQYFEYREVPKFKELGVISGSFVDSESSTVL